LVDYDVVVPRKVWTNGQTVSTGHLSHDYSISAVQQQAKNRRRRRSAGVDQDLEDSLHHVHYRFNISGREKHLQLRPNLHLLAPSFVVERSAGPVSANKTTDGQRRRRSLSGRRLLPARDHQCHYVGQVRGHPESQVAISTCGGLVSVFHVISFGSLLKRVRRPRRDSISVAQLGFDSYGSVVTRRKVTCR
jgi:Reprolysin family propeptide